MFNKILVITFIKLFFNGWKLYNTLIAWISLSMLSIKICLYLSLSELWNRISSSYFKLIAISSGSYSSGSFPTWKNIEVQMTRRRHPRIPNLRFYLSMGGLMDLWCLPRIGRTDKITVCTNDKSNQKNYTFYLTHQVP